MEKPNFLKRKPEQEPLIHPEITQQEKVAKMQELVKKINESGESLSFPGIAPEAYLKMKETDENFPGYTTPTDEIIRRCRKEGIKIVFGNDPHSGDVFVLPTGSDDIRMDSIFPRQLAIEAVTNRYLRELIELSAIQIPLL